MYVRWEIYNYLPVHKEKNTLGGYLHLINHMSYGLVLTRVRYLKQTILLFEQRTHGFVHLLGISFSCVIF